MGSRIIGWIAGPIMVLWFLTIAALGLYQILLNPEFPSHISHQSALKSLSSLALPMGSL
jgi:K+ transporter